MEATVESYNKDFSSKQYDMDWKTYGWGDIIKESFSFLNTDDKIFEMGCGCGQYAQALDEYGFKNYIGFDFSDVAIKKARILNKFNPNCRNIFKANIYDVVENLHFWNFDTIVCFEVLEHIDDLKILEALSNYKKGLKFIGSVPNFKSEGHLRTFGSEKEIVNRYEDYLKILSIKRIDNKIYKTMWWYLFVGEII